MALESIVHFGLNLKSRTRGFHLTRENYATISNKSTFGKDYSYVDALKNHNEERIRAYSEIYADTEGRFYTDIWCKKHLIEVMENFDLNICYFEKLNRSKFNREIDKFLKKTNFFEITDLSQYSCSGYYVMILDKYCQLYVGTSESIKKRIRGHWGGGKMRFDRLVFGDVTRSRLSIDSFRALDTTRILVYPCKTTYMHEDKYINHFSDEFVCNRIGGGRVMDMDFGFISAIASIKTRNLL